MTKIWADNHQNEVRLNLTLGGVKFIIWWDVSSLYDSHINYLFLLFKLRIEGRTQHFPIAAFNIAPKLTMKGFIHYLTQSEALLQEQI